MNIINSKDFDKLYLLLKYIGPAVDYLNIVAMKNTENFLSVH
jgi:hypothetical protein